MKLKNYVCSVTTLILIVSNGIRNGNAEEKDKTSESSTRTSKTNTSAESSSKKGRLFSSQKTLISCSPSFSKEKSSGRLTLVEVKDPSVFLSEIKQLPILKNEIETIRIDVEEPGDDDEALKKARKEIGEPDVIDSAKAELIAKLEELSGWEVPTQNNAWLLRFLRIKNYDVEATFELIKRYYKMKSDRSGIFDYICPPDLLSVFEKNIFVVMANRDQLGRRIFIFRAELWKPEEINALHLLKAIVLFIEASAYEPTSQIVGVQVIVDLKNLSGAQTFEIKKHARLVMDYLQYASPLKIERFHIVNQSLLVRLIIAIYRQFAADIMHGKALFYKNNFEKLHESILPEYLPSMYGGTAPLSIIEPDEWSEILKIATREYERIMWYGVRTIDQPQEPPTTQTTSSKDKKNIGKKKSKLCTKDCDNMKG